MTVTIKDVAKRANVSPSTVSRVISDSDKISVETKKRVRNAMEELGYHINLNARVLVQQSTKTIGVVLKHSLSQSWNWINPFTPEAQQGISSHCHQHQYSLSITTGSSEDEIYDEVVKMVQGKRVDGVIVLYSKIEDKVVPFLIENNIPFTVVGKPMQRRNEIMYVDNDNINAGEQATNFLINHNHKFIGFIGEDPDFQVIRDRVNGYLKAVEDNKLPVDGSYIEYIKIPEDTDYKVKKLLNKKNPPTALVISHDIQGMLVLKALKKYGLSVPEDISLITFNRTILTEFAIPSLTTIDTEAFQLGYEASRGVIELINNPNAFKRSVIIPTKIESRESHKRLVKDNNYFSNDAVIEKEK
ncbi:LacI family DNA-binding transcriptional regulator [Oceanobacillus timonensis]|uniref:LacI family DNA-binding transcriptional regulator n=1 Tax=Oceanobacillus timonensis TaxID=1926285 RepID=UPI0009BC0DC4|nr:LacI family DNA-binding transcriptional regulator [Oceanobacillus timonensis]